MARLGSLLKALRSLAATRRDRRGNVALIFALAAPVVIGLGGLSAESIYWYFKRVQLQSAADAAAYAAAIEARSGSAYASIQSTAASTAKSDGFAPAIGTIVVNTPPASGPNQNGNAVEVILTQPQQRFFSQMFDTSRISQTVRAVAVYKTASNACILALNKSASGAAQVSGSATVVLDGCDVMANSISSAAITVAGSGQLTADCAVAVGGVTSNGSLTLKSCTAVQTQASPVADPFANLPAPAIPGACLSAGGTNLQPGYYCGGMSLSGNVTLQPGVYYVAGNGLKINSSTTVTGSGVTIYLSGSARVSMNGAAKATLSAPTSGTYAGVLFFGDRSSTGGSNTFNGTADSAITGDLYFPTQQVAYLGNFSGDDGCTHIVADTVTMSGHSNVSVNCSSHGMSKIPAMQSVALAE